MRECVYIRKILGFKHVCRWIILYRDSEKRIGETGFRCGDIGTVLVWLLLASHSFVSFSSSLSQSTSLRCFNSSFNEDISLITLKINHTLAVRDSVTSFVLFFSTSHSPSSPPALFLSGYISTLLLTVGYPKKTSFSSFYFTILWMCSLVVNVAFRTVIAFVGGDDGTVVVLISIANKYTLFMNNAWQARANKRKIRKTSR